MTLPPTPPAVVVLDLDGVVWLALEPIPGSAEAVAALRAGGVTVLFATNNSAPRVADHEQALAAIGIPAEGCVVTSAQAAASLVAPEERVLVVGGVGLHEALMVRGAVVVDGAEADRGTAVDVVVAGLDRRFTYDTLRQAATAVRRGARLIASNDDATYPTPAGPIPGGGAMVAAVATAAGVAPVVAGKPHLPMAELVLARSGGADPSTMVMVGDRPETDGLFARRIGCRYAQVRTGVVPAGVPVPLADVDCRDLLGVANVLLTGSAGRG